MLKAQVCGKENMLLRDRNDLNSDPADSTASRPGSLQIPGASVLAQNDRGASGRSAPPAQSLPAPPRRDHGIPIKDARRASTALGPDRRSESR